jgi:hypothetical protein
MLLHSAVTNTKDVVPSTVPGATDPWALSRSLVAWLTVVLLWAAAGYFLFDAPETIASPASSAPYSCAKVRRRQFPARFVWRPGSPGIHMTASATRPLWTCPRCRRRFANRNQTHVCGRSDLTHHFRGKAPIVRALYESVRRAIARCGPVTVLAQKSRIAFQVRMSFAQVTPRRRWLDGHLVLARRLPHPRFRRIDTLSPRNHVHHFRLRSPAEVDREFRAWLREAYAVGAQEHLRLPARRPVHSRRR